MQGGPPTPIAANALSWSVSHADGCVTRSTRGVETSILMTDSNDDDGHLTVWSLRRDCEVVPGVFAIMGSNNPQCADHMVAFATSGLRRGVSIGVLRDVRTKRQDGVVRSTSRPTSFAAAVTPEVGIGTRSSCARLSMSSESVAQPVDAAAPFNRAFATCRVRRHSARCAINPWVSGPSVPSRG